LSKEKTEYAFMGIRNDKYTTYASPPKGKKTNAGDLPTNVRFITKIKDFSFDFCPEDCKFKLISPLSQFL